MDDPTLAALRYCVQRILVPIVVVIGLFGNILTVVVLTRRRMRNSTNVYLSALACADIVYLLFIFVLSLQHYPNINHSKYKIYWSTFGLSHWFCDASSYTSIYLTVSFTIERYIAVCHPIRGQVLCTESRAKRVIAGVVLVCFFLTISTAFEYKLSQKVIFIDKKTHQSCEGLMQNITNSRALDETTKYFVEKSNGSEILNKTNILASSRTRKKIPILYTFKEKGKENRTISTCMVVDYVHAIHTDFGNNEVYKEIFYVFSSIFTAFVPLVLLATFNCLLVAAVHRSHKMRHEMTNNTQNDAMAAAENKVTVTLIAVVLLFLLCQSPGAIQLIYTMKAVNITNMNRAINNVCNFLVTINAASNFFLYCALSDKYRKTVKKLLLGFIPLRTNTISTSRYVSGITTTTSWDTEADIEDQHPIPLKQLTHATNVKRHRKQDIMRTEL